MAYYIGLDVSVESTAVCVIDAAGCVKKEFSARNHAEDLANALDPFSDEIAGIGLEAGPISGLLVGGLKQRGYDLPLIFHPAATGARLVFTPVGAG